MASFIGSGNIGGGVCSGLTYGVALAEGTDVEEGESFVALEELKGGDLACKVSIKDES